MFCAIIKAWNNEASRQHQIVGAKAQALKNVLDLMPQTVFTEVVVQAVSEMGWGKCPCIDDGFSNKRIYPGFTPVGRSSSLAWRERLKVTDGSMRIMLMGQVDKHKKLSLTCSPGITDPASIFADCVVRRGSAAAMPAGKVTKATKKVKSSKGFGKAIATQKKIGRVKRSKDERLEKSIKAEAKATKVVPVLARHDSAQGRGQGHKASRGKSPGFQEGMKVPGQEEREQLRSLRTVASDLIGEERRQADQMLREGWRRVRRKEEELVREILQQSEVVCATLVGCGSPAVVGMRFPLVVIDEATQATEASTLVALCRGAQQVVLLEQRVLVFIELTFTITRLLPRRAASSSAIANFSSSRVRESIRSIFLHTSFGEWPITATKSMVLCAVV